MARQKHPNGARAIIREVFGNDSQERHIKRLEWYFEKLESRTPRIVETTKEPMYPAGSRKDHRVVRWAAPEARTLFKNLILLDEMVGDDDLVIALVVEADTEGIAELNRRLEKSYRDRSRRFEFLRARLKLVDPLREALRSGRVTLSRNFLEKVEHSPSRTRDRSGQTAKPAPRASPELAGARTNRECSRL